MPTLSSWSIRAALIYLALGFTLGALILAHKGVPLFPRVWVLLPAHIEFLLFGWTVQLALGVAYWILPRFRGGSRGVIWLAWLSIGLLNLGVLLAAAQSVFGLANGLTLAGRLAQLLAAIAFGLHAWARVRPARG